MALRKVARLPLVLPAHHLGIRGVLNDALARLQTTADIRLEADSSRLIKELVESGMGYTILPLAYFRPEYQAGKLQYCPIVNPTLTLCTFLAYRTNDRDTTNRIEGKVIEAITCLMTQLRNA